MNTHAHQHHHPINTSTHTQPPLNPYWNDLLLKQELIHAIEALGYHQPSDIQAKAIPKIVQGHNVICQARAGTGKTVVFILGVLNSMAPQPNNTYLPHQCIVVANTRELAYQIYQEFMKFTQFMQFPVVRVGCYFGGTPIDRDLEQLKGNNTSPHIIIGTPGRLIDLLYRGYINAENVRYFVLDQCDLLLTSSDIKRASGMRQEIQIMQKNFKRQVQYMMLSATLTPSIVAVCKSMCPNLCEVYIDDGMLDINGLAQFFEIIPEKNKFLTLQHILDSTPFNQAIIFSNSIERTIELAQQLANIYFNPICIHSGLTQEQRIQNYEKFKANGSRVLVATDLFGRGIDIERVNLVVNFDFPYDLQHYIHRVGRAGRFNTRGMVISLIGSEMSISDTARLSEYCKQIGCMIARLPCESDLTQFFSQ